MTQIKTFSELTGAEVYEILKARCDVFTVEQRICYPDMDDIDYDSLHVSIVDEKGRVQAYLRLYQDGALPGAVHMGRVLTREHGKGLGREVVLTGIKAARERMGATQILLHSQQYCTGFYEKAGFRVCSDVFIEADIPHVQMVLFL
ncbi:MAG: GNAT family N-acetyltransferase [Bacteroidales bacterium]|nr:GNAT family N-acetyltransferase [Bacteroidales bacterium]